MDDCERELLNCFQRATCESFSHEDHVHVAWLLLRQHPLSAATELFASGARALAASHGKSENYHETVTWAYMILVNQRIESFPDADWEAFRNQNADLFASDQAILKKYYRPSTLESERAPRVLASRHFPTSLVSDLPTIGCSRTTAKLEEPIGTSARCRNYSSTLYSPSGAER